MLDRSSPSAIRRLIHDLGTFPRKKWGQNFLIDHNIIARIVALSQLDKEDFVVEIGPGLGGLTQELARACKAVLAIEIDRRLEPALEDLRLENPNLRITYADVLAIDVEAELVKAFGPEATLRYQVCANIPYNITTPIIFKLLEECPNCQKVTLMMQQEVGDRVAASPGSKDYGRLTLAVAYYADPHPIMKVPRNCFYPRPEVDSTVIQLVRQNPKKVEIINELMFKKFLNGAFQKRRKTILNIAAAFFQQNKDETQLLLAELGIDPHLRPENLTLKDMAGIVNRFAPAIDTEKKALPTDKIRPGSL